MNRQGDETSHDHAACTATADHAHAHPHGSATVAFSALLYELREHVPFSVTAVTIGLVVAGALCIIGAGASGAPSPPWSRVNDVITPVEGGHDHDHATGDPHDHSSAPSSSSVFAFRFFHLFHPAHMLFSATATTAMFWRYDRRRLKAVVIGLLGALGVCGASDILMPQASLYLLGAQTPWHVCIWEHPNLVLPFAAVGILVGLGAGPAGLRGTIVSHSLHVLASTMASIFYMVQALGIVGWIDDIGKVFVFIVLAVMVPCCLSDIVFPVLMSSAGRERFCRQPHVHG